MKVRDAMTIDVATVQPGASLKDAARTLVERRISGLPVVDAAGRLEAQRLSALPGRRPTGRRPEFSRCIWDCRSALTLAACARSPRRKKHVEHIAG